MHKWLYKRDYEDRPRRFLGHGELALWVALRAGGAAGPLLGTVAVAMIFNPQGLDRAGFFLLGSIIVLLAAGAVVCIYLYLMLSGAVMGPEERAEYLNKQREARRGRW